MEQLLKSIKKTDDFIYKELELCIKFITTQISTDFSTSEGINRLAEFTRNQNDRFEKHNSHLKAKEKR